MRLIDADAFFSEFGELDKEPYNNAPTVDPVRHGHWIEANDISSSPFDAMKRCLCSECREWGFVTIYCPNCGAKMDEVTEDDTVRTV